MSVWWMPSRPGHQTIERWLFELRAASGKSFSLRYALGMSRVDDNGEEDALASLAVGEAFAKSRRLGMLKTAARIESTRWMPGRTGDEGEGADVVRRCRRWWWGGTSTRRFPSRCG